MNSESGRGQGLQSCEGADSRLPRSRVAVANRVQFLPTWRETEYQTVHKTW